MGLTQEQIDEQNARRAAKEAEAATETDKDSSGHDLPSDTSTDD